MKQQSPTRPDPELDPALLDPMGKEPDSKTDDDDPFSDELLDEFMQSDVTDSDDYGFGYSGGSKLDGDDDFDSFFRDADGYSDSRGGRRHRGRERHARETFEFEPFDRSDWRAYNQRRPRR